MTAVLTEISRVPKAVSETQKSSQRPTPIVVMRGDGAANALLDASLSVLRATTVPLSFEVFDLSHQNRTRTEFGVVDEAAEALRHRKRGIKAPTKKAPFEPSANRVLREKTAADVIERTAEPYPGTRAVDEMDIPLRAPITVVRMAFSGRVGDRDEIDGDEYAYETRSMPRSRCRKVAEHAFRVAARHGGVVLGGPERTNDTYDGMFTQELFFAQDRHDDITYEGMSIEHAVDFMGQPHIKHLVIPSLERDGNILSYQAVTAMKITPDTTPSTTLSLDSEYQHTVVMTEALDDRSASITFDNSQNPMGMILAGAKLLGHMPDVQAQKASQAISGAVNETLRAGIKTKDLGGSATTVDFTDAIVRGVQERMRSNGQGV